MYAAETVTSFKTLLDKHLIQQRFDTSEISPRSSGSRGRGFEPHSGRSVVSLSKTYLPPKKVLVIPRKRWLHPNMAEKLFTGMLSIKPNQKPKQAQVSGCPRSEGRFLLLAGIYWTKVKVPTIPWGWGPWL